MADLPPYPDSNKDTGVRPGRKSTTSTPRWVKVFAILAIVVVAVLFLINHLIGGGMGGHLAP